MKSELKFYFKRSVQAMLLFSAFTIAIVPPIMADEQRGSIPRVDLIPLPPEDAPIEMFPEGGEATPAETIPAAPVAPSSTVTPIAPAPQWATWVAQGPGATQGGQVENVVPNNEVVGAIHTVVAHPTDPNILYVGAVNGGIWRTTNATAPSPNWTPLTDNLPSLSIGALEFDPANPDRLI
ncbi:MAG: WD40/YVTN/BNR-like repeat-containing protein, partial [Pyrinomonadaceae bacterium]